MPGFSLLHVCTPPPGLSRNPDATRTTWHILDIMQIQRLVTLYPFKPLVIPGGLFANIKFTPKHRANPHFMSYGHPCWFEAGILFQFQVIRCWGCIKLKLFATLFAHQMHISMNSNRLVLTIRYHTIGLHSASSWPATAFLYSSRQNSARVFL